MRIAWKRSAWIIAGATLCAAIGSGQTPQTQPGSALSADDAALLKQLESPQWRQRHEAAKKLDLLARRPDAAEPILEAMRAQTSSPEARIRLDAILGRLGGIRLTQESLITLSLKNVPARLAFEELFRQAQVPLPAESQTLLAGVRRKVSIDASGATFWEVFRKLSAQTGVMVWDDGYFTDDQSSLLTQKIPLPGGPWCVSGPYMVVANSVSYSSGIELRSGKHETWESLTLNMTGFAEPKIVVLWDPYSHVKVLEATDDHGNSLVPKFEYGWISEFNGPGHVWDLAADLAYPRQNPGKKLIHFRAVATAVIQGAFQRIEIPDLMHADPRTLQLGKEAIDFDGCRKAGDHFDLTLIAANDQVRTYQQYLGDFYRFAHITDDAGHVFEVTGDNRVVVGDTIRLTFHLRQRDLSKGQPGSEPTRLLWNATTEWRKVDVPIDLKDLNIDVKQRP